MDIGIAYVYFNYKQSIDNSLSSLLKQLSQEQPSLPDSVKALHGRHKNKKTRPSIDELSRALQSVAAMYSQVFIVADALDECQSDGGCRSTFLLHVFNLQAKTRAKLFATSRHIPDIEQEFKGCLTCEISASDEDVSRYLDGHMSQLPRFVSRVPELQKKIKMEVKKAGEGM